MLVLDFKAVVCGDPRELTVTSIPTIMARQVFTLMAHTAKPAINTAMTTLAPAHLPLRGQTMPVTQPAAPEAAERSGPTRR